MHNFEINGKPYSYLYGVVSVASEWYIHVHMFGNLSSFVHTIHGKILVRKFLANHADKNCC